MIEGVRDFIARHALGKRCTDSACVADNWLRDCTDSACVADKLFKSLAESQSGLWSRGVQNVTAKCVPAPMFTWKEMLLFEETVRGASQYFEFGAGGSTMVAVSLASNVTTADVAMPWLVTVKSFAPSITALHFDIGPIEAYGLPASAERFAYWPQYASAIEWSHPETDVVLVDGRFRVASILCTLLRRPAANVMVHDFGRSS